MGCADPAAPAPSAPVTEPIAHKMGTSERALSGHVGKVLSTREELERDGWVVDEMVVSAMASVDMDAIHRCLAKHREAEPAWKTSYSRHLNDSRVAHLEQGGYVFENLSVYMVLAQLLLPPLQRSPAPLHVLDVGCGTGFLTMVLATIVRERGGHVHAIDIFERQVQHTERDIRECIPELLPYCSFEVANAWEFTSVGKYDAIAVAAQCDCVPQNLVALLKPGGRLVCPLGPVVPIDSSHPGRFNPYWVVEAGEQEGAPLSFNGRAGPISVNFLPLIKPDALK